MIYQLIVKNGEFQVIQNKIPKPLFKTTKKLNQWYKKGDKKYIYSDKPIDLKKAIELKKNLKED